MNSELSWWLSWWRICLQSRRLRFDPWVGKIPWRRKYHLRYSCLGKSHGQRRRVGYSPWGFKELDTTEQLHFHFHIYIYMKSLYNSISLSYVAFKAKYYKIFECSYNKISIININIYSQIWLAFFSTFLVLSYFSHVQLFETLWSVAHQAPLSMGFSRQEHWGGLPCLLQEIFLTQGLNQHVMSSALAGRFFTTSHHLGSHGILGQKNISNSKNIQFISYWFYDCSKLYPV